MPGFRGTCNWVSCVVYEGGRQALNPHRRSGVQVTCGWGLCRPGTCLASDLQTAVFGAACDVQNKGPLDLPGPAAS